MEVADGDVLHVRVVGIEVAQGLLVWMMNRVDEGKMHYPRTRKSRSIIEMQNVTILGRVGDGPCSVIHVLQAGEDIPL